MQQKLVGPAVQRRAVEHAQQLFGISERRACTIFAVDRTSMRYAHRRSDDGDLRSRLREIAAERRRFGYRRLGTMLARQGIVMNHKKLLRLYREDRPDQRLIREINCLADCASGAGVAASERWEREHR